MEEYKRNLPIWKPVPFSKIKNGPIVHDTFIQGRMVDGEPPPPPAFLHSFKYEVVGAS